MTASNNNNNNNVAPAAPLENPTYKLLLTNPLSVNNFKYHPKSVLSGITSNDGLSTVSLKSETAVDFVFKGELVMKLFSLLNEKVPLDSLIDINVDPENDYYLKYDSDNDSNQDELKASLQKEIELLEAEQKTLETKLNSLENNFSSNGIDLNNISSDDNNNKDTSGEKPLDLMKAIRDLADEFVSIEDKSEKSTNTDGDIVMAEDFVDEEKTKQVREQNNNKIRSLFEDRYNCKIIINEDSHVAKNKHLRVLRIGSVNLK